MFFKFINNCQAEILRCAPPSSHVLECPWKKCNIYIFCHKTHIFVMHVKFSKETCLTVWNRIHSSFSSFSSFFGFKHAAVLTDTWIFKNCCKEHLEEIFDGKSDFFRTKIGCKKCILSQIELIRHLNKNTNFRAICHNFKLELTEHIRNFPFLCVLFTHVHID